MVLLFVDVLSPTMESALFDCISTVAGGSSVSLAQAALALSALLMASNVGGL